MKQYILTSDTEIQFKEFNEEPDEQPTPDIDLYLIDPTSDTRKQLLDTTDTIVGSAYNLEAVPPSDTGFVEFWLNGRYLNTEGLAPYAAFGDEGGDFLEEPILPGTEMTNILEVIAFKGTPADRGEEIVRETYTLLVKNDSAPAKPQPGRPDWYYEVLELKETRFVGQTTNTRTENFGFSDTRDIVGMKFTGGVITLKPGAKATFEHFIHESVNGGYFSIDVYIGAEITHLKNFEFRGPRKNHLPGTVIQCRRKAPNQHGIIRLIENGRFLDFPADILNCPPPPEGQLVRNVYFGRQYAVYTGAHADICNLKMANGPSWYERVFFDQLINPESPKGNAGINNVNRANRNNGDEGPGSSIAHDIVSYEKCIMMAEPDTKSVRFQITPGDQYRPKFAFKDCYVPGRRMFYPGSTNHVVKWENVRDVETGELLPLPSADGFN